MGTGVLEEVTVSGARPTVAPPTGAGRINIGSAFQDASSFDIDTAMPAVCAQYPDFPGCSLPEVEVAQPRRPIVSGIDATEEFGRILRTQGIDAATDYALTLDPDVIRQIDSLVDAADQMVDVQRDIEDQRWAQELARRAAVAAAEALPEVVVSAARAAGRIVSSGAFGIASLIPEAAYYVGSYLSDLALRGAVDRITPPPTGTVGSSSREPPDEDPANPIFADYFDPTPVVVSAPRPTNEPIFSPLYQPFDLPGLIGNPFSFSVPTTSPGTPTGAPTLSTPLSFVDSPVFSLFTPQPAPSSPAPRPSTPAPLPLSLASPLTGSGLPPNLIATPTPTSSPDERNCRCSDPKKKKRKKKAREVCYRGEYVERSKGLLKFRKRKIPCQ
jgi:hypothetical protein